MDVRADRFPLVDSLRAIAALAIVGYHAAFFSGGLDQASFGSRLATNLQIGVPIFFLISGFLLYRPLTRARLRGEPSPRTGAYAWRRFLRIVPAYWVALTLAGLLGLAVAFEGTKLLAYYGFAQTYSSTTYFGGLPQAWTLCVEVTFYAFLPLWALALRRLPARSPRDWLRQELLLLGLLFALSQAYKLVLALSVDLNALSSQPLMMLLPNFLDLFAVGMAIAVVSVWVEERSEGSRELPLLDARSWAPWAAAAAAFVAVLALGPAGELEGRVTRSEFLLRHNLWLLCALGVVLPAMLGDHRSGTVRRLLSARVLFFLGLISYGIFLQHLTVMSQLEDWGFDAPVPWLGWAVVGGAGAIALGAASYYLVERPVLKLKRLVAPRPPQAAGEALAETAPLAPAESGSAASR
jgi:peptidoglycan/LPS O-acetylase OafA/YrhL